MLPPEGIRAFRAGEGAAAEALHVARVEAATPTALSP
jgi:hypothetical protein